MDIKNISKVKVKEVSVASASTDLARAYFRFLNKIDLFELPFRMRLPGKTLITYKCIDTYHNYYSEWYVQEEEHGYIETYT